jgi:hypothetical protein
MITGITHLHSGLRWLVIITLIVTIVKHFMGSKNNLTYKKGDKSLALMTLILVHVQFLAGLFLYFGNGWSKFEAGTMSNAVSRFWSVEHIAGMLIAIVLITVGYSSAKRLTDDAKKYKKIFTFYLIGFILIIASIPWPFRGEIARGWF